MTVYNVEATDTYGGEANYSWGRRYSFTAPADASDALLIRRAHRLLGYSGSRYRKESYNGDTIRLDYYGACICTFIVADYDAPDCETWHYVGDINLKHGGYYWREDGFDDYVLAVQVTPCSDAGGPDNQWWIESGSIYMPADKRDSWLDYIGVEPGKATRADYVQAALAYHGIEPDIRETVQIGKEQEATDSWQWGDTREPYTILHGNASLRRYIEREYLN